MIERHIKELSEVSLCKFYSEKKDFIERLLEDTKKTDTPPPREQINIQIQRF